jgi:translation elongation factor EF-Ts
MTPTWQWLDRMHLRARFIQSYVHHGCVGALVEFGLESRYVTVHPAFLELSRSLAAHIAYSNPDSLDALLQQAHFNDPAVNVQKALADASGRLGTSVTVTRFIRWSNEPRTSAAALMSAKDPPLGKKPVLGCLLSLIAGRSLDEVYPQVWFIESFADGSLGVLVEFGLETWRATERSEFLELSHALAKWIGAINPESLDALLRHAIGEDPTRTVEKLLAVLSRIQGERISVTRFVRWECLPDHAPVPPKDPAVTVRLKRA